MLVGESPHILGLGYGCSIPLCQTAVSGSPGLAHPLTIPQLRSDSLVPEVQNLVAGNLVMSPEGIERSE